MFYSLRRYSFLIRQLVNMDFKKKYKRSILGVLWSFLNPLLLMTIQHFVFSNIFRSSILYFAAYLIIGSISFNFFSEATGVILTSITGNSRLITKVYLPKYIYPLIKIISSVINLAISMIPLALVCFMTGVGFHKTTLLSLYFWMCLIIFSFSIGLILATLMVFFRDTQFLWHIFTMMWMYMTPIFYPENILPEKYKIVLLLNPLYHFLKNIRLCILYGEFPPLVAYGQCLGFSLLALAIGSFIFAKNQDRFILYL